MEFAVRLDYYNSTHTYIQSLLIGGNVLLPLFRARRHSATTVHPANGLRCTTVHSPIHLYSSTVTCKYILQQYIHLYIHLYCTAVQSPIHLHSSTVTRKYICTAIHPPVYTLVQQYSHIYTYIAIQSPVYTLEQQYI